LQIADLTATGCEEDFQWLQHQGGGHQQILRHQHQQDPMQDSLHSSINMQDSMHSSVSMQDSMHSNMQDSMHSQCSSQGSQKGAAGSRRESCDSAGGLHHENGASARNRGENRHRHDYFLTILKHTFLCDSLILHISSYKIVNYLNFQ